MASQKATIIFVPGAWHSPEGYATVRAELETHDYAIVGVALPSVGAEPPLKTWDKDVEAIQAAIKDVVDKGGDVVLVMHSYSGLPGCEAARGFVKAQREKEGEKGGIVALVFLCAFVLAEGDSLAGAVGLKGSGWIDIDVCFFFFLGPPKNPSPLLSPLPCFCTADKPLIRPIF